MINVCIHTYSSVKCFARLMKSFDMAGKKTFDLVAHDKANCQDRECFLYREQVATRFEIPIRLLKYQRP
jgi:hypothetical protein